MKSELRKVISKFEIKEKNKIGRYSRGVSTFFALLALLAQLALLVINEGAAAEFYYKKS